VSETIKVCEDKTTTVANGNRKRTFDWNRSPIAIKHISNNLLIKDKKAFTDWFTNTYSKTLNNSIEDNNNTSNNQPSQTKYKNYYEPIFAKESITTKKSAETMPLLQTKTYLAPILEQNEIDDTNEEGWIQCNQKEIDQERKVTLLPRSSIYLPQGLPIFSDKNKSIKQTHMVLALSIQMTHSRQ
jgi:hypothetical protein